MKKSKYTNGNQKDESGEWRSGESLGMEWIGALGKAAEGQDAGANKRGGRYWSVDCMLFRFMEGVWQMNLENIIRPRT
jgi:hypothetical protein